MFVFASIPAISYFLTQYEDETKKSTEITNEIHVHVEPNRCISRQPSNKLINLAISIHV